MTYSLAEIESLCAKAARGAGFAWGQCEDVGRAVRWLAGHGFAAPALLCRLLACHEDQKAGKFDAKVSTNQWRANDGHFCPICAGALCSDGCREISFGSGLDIYDVSTPAFLLPFVADAADRLGLFLTVSSGADTATVGAAEVWCADDVFGVSLDVATKITIRVARGGPKGAPRARLSRVAISAEKFEILAALAHRTYAPATDASRQLGAG